MTQDKRGLLVYCLVVYCSTEIMSHYDVFLLMTIGTDIMTHDFCTIK